MGGQYLVSQSIATDQTSTGRKCYNADEIFRNSCEAKRPSRRETDIIDEVPRVVKIMETGARGRREGGLDYGV